MARANVQAMTMTDAAAAQVKELLTSQEEPALGLRVGVKNGGCSGMAYTMEFAKEIGPHDEVVEEKGVTILVDPTAIMFLIGTEMDYLDGSLQSGFVFNNPNEAARCGCGESFTV